MIRHFRVTNHAVRYLSAALMVVSMMALASGSADAQYFFYGRRAVVARPVVPVPPPVFYGPTAIHSGPGTFSIRSPFFSFRVDAAYPPAYGYRTYSAYPVPDYRYEPALPGYPLPSYPTPTLRYSTPIPDRIPTDGYGSADGFGNVSPAPRYAPGVSGGIPDLTAPAPAITARPPMGDAMPSDIVSGDAAWVESGSGLVDAANRLRSALSTRASDADVWLDYLQPRAIAIAAQSGRLSSDIVALEQRYEGVTMNPKLRAISRLPGFERTRVLLSQWIRSTPDEPRASTVVPADSPKPAESGTADLPSGLPTTSEGAAPANEPMDDNSRVDQTPSAEPPPELIETLPEPIKDNDV